jgi:hypothetical protein
LRHIWMINKQNCWCFSQKKQSHFNQSSLLFSMVVISRQFYFEPIPRYGVTIRPWHLRHVLRRSSSQLSFRGGILLTSVVWSPPRNDEEFSTHHMGFPRKCMVQPHHFQGYHCWFSRCEDMERYLVVLCRSKCKHEMQSRSAICFVMRSFDC